VDSSSSSRSLIAVAGSDHILLRNQLSWASWGSILAGKGKRHLRKFHFDKPAGAAIGMDRRTVESAAYLSHVSRYSGGHFSPREKVTSAFEPLSVQVIL
jgi:hypothetical protein